MENILEIIFTIIAGFFWLFGSTIFKKREEDEYPEPTVSRKEKRQRGNQKSGEEEARQREIRESILRKISERRQQSEPEPALAMEPQYQEPYTEPQEAVDEPFFYEESIQEEVAEAPFSWNTDEGTYEQEMQERLKEIEATKRRAEALKKKARQVTQDHYAADHERSSREGHVLSVGSVHSALKNPENVRAAFLYAEILGKPVSLRNSAERGPVSCNT